MRAGNLIALLIAAILNIHVTLNPVAARNSNPGIGVSVIEYMQSRSSEIELAINNKGESK